MNFFAKQLIKSKLKDLPTASQEKVLKALEENPELFSKIAQEIKAKIKEGKDQMSAAMEVMQKYQEELKKLF